VGLSTVAGELDAGAALAQGVLDRLANEQTVVGNQDALAHLGS
jgi:hypothetical protein